MQIAPLPTRPPWSRGMFVPPEQIAESGKCHPELGRLRLVVTREADVITLKAECTSPNDALQDQLAASLRAVTKLGGSVELVPSGSLPNDGKAISRLTVVGRRDIRRRGYALPLLMNTNSL